MPKRYGTMNKGVNFKEFYWILATGMHLFRRCLINVELLVVF